MSSILSIFRSKQWAMFRNHATDGITVSWLTSLHMSWFGVKAVKTVESSYLYIYGGYSKKGFCDLFQIYSSEFLCERLWWCGHTSRPSDAMQMLPWPWPPAHTMPGPKRHRCHATFSLGQLRAALCRMWTVPTLLLCSLLLSSGV